MKLRKLSGRPVSICLFIWLALSCPAVCLAAGDSPDNGGARAGEPERGKESRSSRYESSGRTGEVLELDSSEMSVADLLSSAASLIEKGFLQSAAERYRQVLVREPDNITARNNLAVVLKRQGKEAQAIEHLNRAISLEPNRAELFNNLATAYLSAGKLDDALDNAYRAIALKPVFPAAQSNLGNLLAARGDYSAAVTAYQQAIKDSSASPGLLPLLHRDLGDCLRALGRNEQALIEYKSAERLGDGSPDCSYRIARALEGVGRLDDSRKILNALVDREPERAQYLNSLAVVLWRMGHLPESAYVLEKVLKLDPLNYSARNNLGIVLFDLHRFDESVNVLRQAILIKPDYDNAHYNLALALFRSGLYSQAAEAFERCIELSRSRVAASGGDDTKRAAQAYNNLGICLMRTSREDQALAAFRDAIRADSELAEAYTNMGIALRERAALHNNSSAREAEDAPAAEPAASSAARPDS